MPVTVDDAGTRPDELAAPPPWNDLSMPKPPPRPSRELRVLVAADLLVVAETVRSALRARGVDAVPVDWPFGWPFDRPLDVADAADGTDRATSGLLLSDLSDAGQVLRAAEVIRSVRVRWVVQTVAPRGEAWGAMLAAGAGVVVPADLSLAEVVRVLEGDLPDRLSIPTDERDELVRAWRAADVRRSDLLLRVRRLSDDEVETLRMLYAGDSVRLIARRLRVSEPTVRSRVRSILATLGVRSELGAVAAFGELRRIVGNHGS